MNATLRAIGVDIGVTNVKSICVGNDERIIAQDSIATRSDDPHWPDRVREHLANLQAQHGTAQSIGIAAPGIADPTGRQIWWMQGRLAEVQGLDWSAFLNRTPVPVLNDAQAALLGEVWRGAAAGKKNVIMLTLGTGVGGAAMVDGRLLKGNLGRAGHLGHISLDIDGDPDIVNTPGSLENAVGNCTIEQRTGGRFGSTHDLVAARLKGDPGATEVWGRLVRTLACGIASLVNVLDPEVVIIGGGIATASRALLDPLEREMQHVEWRPHDRRVTIVPAKLGEFAGAYGAAWNAINEEPP